MFNLDDLYNNKKLREAEHLAKIKSGKSAFAEALVMIAQAEGMKYLSDSNSLMKVKQAFYISGKIDIYLVKKVNARFLEWSIFRPSFAILSDCKPMILKYGRLSFSEEQGNPSMDQLKTDGAIAPMSSLLLAMAEDWEGLEKDLAIVKEKALSKKKNNYMEPDYAFLLGLLHRNRTEIESSLQEMMTPARLKQRHYDPLFAQYLALPAAAYMKLAWLHGFEIKIEHKLLPAKLFPVNPNPVYEDTYDFLNELPN